MEPGERKLPRGKHKYCCISVQQTNLVCYHKIFQFFICNVKTNLFCCSFLYLQISLFWIKCIFLLIASLWSSTNFYLYRGNFSSFTLFNALLMHLSRTSCSVKDAPSKFLSASSKLIDLLYVSRLYHLYSLSLTSSRLTSIFISSLWRSWICFTLISLFFLINNN